MSSQQLLSFTSFAIVCSSAIWVLRDAKRIGIVKGRFTGLANMGPWGWCIACLFVWIIAFPLYIVKRREVLQGNQENKISHKAVTAVGAFVYVLEFIVIAVLVFGHPKESTAQLTTQVRQSIVKKFANNPAFEHVRVGSLRLVHDSGNEYQGLLKVSSGGDTSNLTVDVIYDGRTFMWHIAYQTGAFSDSPSSAPPASTANHGPSNAKVLREIWQAYYTPPSGNQDGMSFTYSHPHGRLLKKGTVLPSAMNSSLGKRLPAYLACYHFISAMTSTFGAGGASKDQICVYFILNAEAGTESVMARGPHRIGTLKAQMARDGFVPSSAPMSASATVADAIVGQWACHSSMGRTTAFYSSNGTGRISMQRNPSGTSPVTRAALREIFRYSLTGEAVTLTMTSVELKFLPKDTGAAAPVLRRGATLSTAGWLNIPESFWAARQLKGYAAIHGRHLLLRVTDHVTPGGKEISSDTKSVCTRA